MPRNAVDIQGQVHKLGTVTNMARICGDDAQNIIQSDISTITYSIFRLDENSPDSRTAVENHEDVAATVADVVFNTLQTDDRWKYDSTGYNFRHTIDIATNAAFAVAGVHYLVEYVLTPVSGQKIVVRFDLECI